MAAASALLKTDGEASYVDEADRTKGNFTARDSKEKRAQEELSAEVLNGQKELDQFSVSDTSSVNAIILGPTDVVAIKDHEVLDDEKLHFLVEMVDGDEKWEPLEFFQVEQQGDRAYVPSLLTYVNEKNLRV